MDLSSTATVRGPERDTAMRLRRLGITGRIYVGFGSSLAIGLALACIALWALFSINREVTRMDATSDHTAMLREVSRDIEIMRSTAQRNSLGEKDIPIYGQLNSSPTEEARPPRDRA
jgi:hypothetical protein